MHDRKVPDNTEEETRPPSLTSRCMPDKKVLELQNSYQQKQQLIRKPRLVYNCQQREENRARDTANKPSIEADKCEIRWSRTTQLWSQSDRLVRELITHTNGGAEGQPMYQLDGKEAENIKSEYTDLSSEQHDCAKPTCVGMMNWK